MQMGPTGAPQQMRANPDQLISALIPLVNDAMRTYEGGTALPNVLCEAVLTGFLAGRGLAPAAATELVQQWRTSGMAQELARQPRMMAPAPTTAPTPGPMPVAMPQQGQPPAAVRRAELLRQIEQAIQDQVTAGAFYRQLVDAAQLEPVKAYISVALEDEQKHARMLQELYRELTGRTFAAEPQPVQFPNLMAGLKQALDNELEAAEFYRSIYLANRDERIRNLFFELMTDEMEHATRFVWAQWYQQASGGGMAPMAGGAVADSLVQAVERAIADAVAEAQAEAEAEADEEGEDEDEAGA